MFLETNDVMYEFLSSFDDEYTTTCPKCCTLSPSGVICAMCAAEDTFNHLNSLDTEPDSLFC
jgi:hypothetical protein